MTIILINKILIILYILSLLNVVRHLYYLIQAAVISKPDVPVKYKLNGKSLLVLGISLAYIISVIFTGFKI